MPESEIDLYEILHLHPSAPPEVVQAAYRRLALLYHPDKNPSPEATELMARVNAAYAILSEPTKRAEYDRERQETMPSAPPSGSTRSHPTQVGNFITFGSSKKDVLRIQGLPTRTYTVEEGTPNQREVWDYGADAHIVFDLYECVQGWSNHGGSLDISVIPGENVAFEDSFKYGDHKDQVVWLHGAPDSASLIPRKKGEGAFESWIYGDDDEEAFESWDYNFQSVWFSYPAGRVFHWDDEHDSLKVVNWTREMDEFNPATGARDVVISTSMKDDLSPDHATLFVCFREGLLYICLLFDKEVCHFEKSWVQMTSFGNSHDFNKFWRWRVGTDRQSFYLPPAKTFEALSVLLKASSEEDSMHKTVGFSVFPFGENRTTANREEFDLNAREGYTVNLFGNDNAIGLFSIDGFAHAVAPLIEAVEQFGVSPT